MSCESLVQLINEYIKKNLEKNRQYLENLMVYIKNDPRCFERIREENFKDIASNILLFSPDYKKILCLWHKKIKAWTFPGGHCDGNSDIHTVAHNELAEETGIVDAKIIDEVPFHIQRFDYEKKVYGYTKSIYAFFFVATLPDGQQPQIMEPDKCGEIRWFSSEDFEELTKNDKYNVNKIILKKWRESYSKGWQNKHCHPRFFTIK